jgi:hypothetical protein
VGVRPRYHVWFGDSTECCADAGVVMCVDDVLVERRDARLTRQCVLVFLLERYFSLAPDLEARRLTLVDELCQLVDSEHQHGERALEFQAGCTGWMD